MLAPGAEFVDGTGDQLLARTGLPGDQHRAVGLRDLLEGLANVPQAAAVADQVREIVLGLDLIAQVDVLPLQLGLQLGQLAGLPGDLELQLLDEARLQLVGFE